MLPDGEPGSDSKPSSSHASTADERVESIPDGDEGEEVSDEAGENNENTNDGDENSDAASNEDAALSPSDPEDSSDMFSDDDSDMSYVEDSDPDDQEVREELAGTLLLNQADMEMMLEVLTVIAEAFEIFTGLHSSDAMSTSLTTIQNLLSRISLLQSAGREE